MAHQAPINGRFSSHEKYKAGGGPYTLLPFRFLSLDADRHLLTNFIGEHLVLPKEATHRFVRKEIPIHSDLYNTLKTKHFLLDSESRVALELLAAKYRTKQAPLADFTKLHIFVVTLRCDHVCPYCQASRQPVDQLGCDMTEPMADKAIDFMFRSPAPALTLEFQGGEPLLAFNIIRYIVMQARQRNATEARDLRFVICTNLSPLTDEILAFCAEHGICISTSLDGPRDLHNANRHRSDGDSYASTVNGIRRVKEFLGVDSISALMTTTVSSLSQYVEIIDEYIRQGFASIFFRPIHPYGYAVRTGAALRYPIEEWMDFYKQAMKYIVEVNQQGVFLREEYATLILRKMLTPFGIGYVDLQSPAGIGLSVIVFNYDGGVYASDESRMLAEMGDQRFRLGSLLTDTYEAMMLSDTLLEPLKASMTEGMPGCSDCGIQPFCGSDPVRHYRLQGDIVGFKPTSEFCRRNMETVRHLVHLLEDDQQARAVLRSWI